MDAASLVLYEKVNGILNAEIGSYEICSGLNYVYKAYVESGTVYVFLSTGADVSDEEYNAIYDEYDMKFFIDNGFEISEIEDEYNPVWLVKLPFDDEHEKMQEKLNDIISHHEIEINRILTNESC